MANRNFANAGKIYAMQVSPVISTTTITIGATGAVASFTGTLTSSVERISKGVYKINSADSYYAVLSTHGSVQSPAIGLSDVMAIEIQNNPSASMASATPSLTIKCLDIGGSVVDPAEGSVLDIMILLNNSSVKS